MNGRDRFLSVLEGNRPDKLPVFLRDFTLGMDVIGCRTTDVFTKDYDPIMSSKSVSGFGRFTGQDAIIGCVHSPAFIVESLGGCMRYPEWGIPVVKRHPIEGLDDLARAEIRTGGKFLGAIESYRITKCDNPDLAVVANVTGPLTKASVLMGLERLTFAMTEGSEMLAEVFGLGEVITRMFLEGVRDCSDAVFIAAAADNPSLFGYDIFSRYTIPSLRSLTKTVHSLCKPVIFHPHGDFTAEGYLDECLFSGIECFQFAEGNDPAVICDSIGDSCAVMGGTDIVPTLYSGTVKEIVEESDRYIHACSDGRYIFSCSCSLQRGVPLRNISAMISSVRRH